MDLDSPFTKTSATEELADRIIMAKALEANPSLYDKQYGYSHLAKSVAGEVDEHEEFTLDELVDLRNSGAFADLDPDDQAAVDAEIAAQTDAELRDILMTLPGKDLQEVLEENPGVYEAYFAN
jgi:hypothetical protein